MAATSPYEGTSPIASVEGLQSGVSLISGRSFALSDGDGNMRPTHTQGLFVLDTRVLSRWVLTLDGEGIERLGVDSPMPSRVTFLGRGRAAQGRADADVVVRRRRYFAMGMHDEVIVTNHGLTSVELTLRLDVDCDFADLFEVKESRLVHRNRARTSDDRVIRFSRGSGHDAREVAVEVESGATIDEEGVVWTLTLGARQSWRTDVAVRVMIDGAVVGPRGPEQGADAETPLTTEPIDVGLIVDSDSVLLDSILRRTSGDLDALSIRDDDYPDLQLVAAGAPWFMTLFGRDSLMTAWMSLISGPSLARGVLLTLGRLQGTRVHLELGEEPGKILHEVRFSESDAHTFKNGEIYYGSADATPLFVMLAAQIQRWGRDDDLLEALMPHVDRAIEWIETYGDRDGDGYVEYQRHGEFGLANQGWKDSWDAIRHADGALAVGPIALCEVQGYVYAAYLARAELAALQGDDETHDRFLDKAARLFERFNADFWDEDGQFYVLALDGDKRRVAVRSSNVGHCLWTGIVRQDRAELVRDGLTAEGTFSGWGVRTLDSHTASYNPVSYHNGSVWPHDTAIAAYGLARYGFVTEASHLISAQMDVAEAFDGRLPELFAGFTRSEFGVPAAYPSSCSPQAWASAAPLLWLRTLLGLEPVASEQRFWLRPELPAGMRRLRVEGVVISGRRITIDIEDERVALFGAGDLAVVPATRPVFSAVGASSPARRRR
ncbi:glycogen debranching N-terminal domain-containing protein [Salinibacterium sp. ZJ450]|uniref:amylo-alpha-1,6-glucosidase n=1 Tax=Salinibacterium sp. ZJ450 TaxID=2708338 RepID=UPI00141FEC2B|nr:glycogen debranching N-terminal domain-containing protein [Salinibacterium sp. ZJ450]